jgi:hypothetical protein
MLGSIVDARQLRDLAVISGTTMGTYCAGLLSLILIMPPLRMSLYYVQFGAGKVLLVWHGRRVTVQWRVLPCNLGVLGVWRDTRSLALRIWIFRVFQLLAVVGWGVLAALLTTPGSSIQSDVWAGTLVAVCGLLASRTSNKRSFIGSLFNPRPKADPEVLARAIPYRYALIRFAQGDDRPMREVADEGGPDALPPARIAYIEGRFVDALDVLDSQLALLASRSPAAAERFRAEYGAHLAELALYAVEAQQIPVTEGLPRVHAAMAAKPLPPAYQALLAVLSGDPQAALPWARQARPTATSRLDLADIYCTLAHVHGVLGDRAKAYELLDRARALVPIYARPDHVARRLEAPDPQAVDY